jgi:predicted GTPase
MLTISERTDAVCGVDGWQDALLEAYSLGLGDPLALSAAHNEGVGDLTRALIQVRLALNTGRRWT